LQENIITTNNGFFWGEGVWGGGNFCIVRQKCFSGGFCSEIEKKREKAGKN